MTTPCYRDEMMLAGWRETSNGGATVTFFLPDPSALDVFRGMTTRKGNTAGQRFACVLVEIGDDEKPVSAPDPAQPEQVEEAGHYGHYYTALYKAGWFHCPQVKERLGDTEPAVKAELHQIFGVESLRDVPPLEFARAMQKRGLYWTLPTVLRVLR